MADHEEDREKQHTESCEFAVSISEDCFHDAFRHVIPFLLNIGTFQREMLEVLGLEAVIYCGGTAF